MSWSFVGFTLDVVGKLLLGATVLFVHRRLMKEHKVGQAVLKELSKEQLMGGLGLLFIVVGYILQIPSKVGGITLEESAYFLGSLVFLSFWLFLFWRAKAFRKEMLIFSGLIAIVGPLSEYWYFRDYWNPNVLVPLPIGSLEDVLFGFSIGGIGAFIYEAFFVRGLCYCEQAKLKREWFLLVFAAVELIVLYVLNRIFGVNSILASSAGMLLTAIIMLLIRQDLIMNAVFSGLLVASVMFTIYLLPQLLFQQVHPLLSKIWKLYDTGQGYLIFGHVPLTEMVWGFSWGLVWGPMYEFLIGARIITWKTLLNSDYNQQKGLDEYSI